jgi:hypothetical protein
MKTLLIILPCFFLVQTCIIRDTDKKSLTEKNTTQKNDTIDPITIGFEKQVKPIFVKNCSPCHFTGGKMYERLPFDKDTTILNHHEAILKRIKNEEENAILKNFVLQNKNGLPGSKPYY